MNFPQIPVSIGQTVLVGRQKKRTFFVFLTKAISLSLRPLEEFVAFWIGNSVNICQMKHNGQETGRKQALGFLANKQVNDT